MVKVSVIIPVFNTEKYLEQCIESVLNQTLTDIEVILVDNGSTDNSSDMIDEYQAKYPEKIKAIHTKVADVSLARNLGFSLSTGRYIAYLDSDDYVHPTIYERLYTKAQLENFDIVTCNIFYVYKNCNVQVSSGIYEDIFTSDKIRDSIISIYPAVWNKIYRRNILEEIRFTPSIWFEDVDFLYRLHPSYRSIGVVNEALVYYRQREDSITHIFDDRLYDYTKNFSIILIYYKEKGLYSYYCNQLEYLYVRYAFATMIKRMSKMKTRKAFLSGYKFARQSVRNNFPQYRRNILFYRSLKGLYLVFFCRAMAELVYIWGKVRK